jgi:hypothetical protein
MNFDEKTNITINGITHMNNYVPIHMEVVIVIHESYIDFTIKVDKPYIYGKWDDHPFSVINKSSITNVYTNRIMKTRSTLTILSELITPVPISIKHISDCTHRAQLIAALDHFWH